MSLTASLFIGRSAIMTRQEQMNVLGNNISNADRPGYHRQETEVLDNAYTLRNRLFLGSGAHVERVVRVFDEAMENNYRTATQREAFYEQYSRYLEVTERTLANEGNSDHI